MDLTQFIVISLATWRIINFIYDDKWAGPLNVLHKLRYEIGIRYDEKNRRAVVAKPAWKRELASMHNCPYCMSFWYALAFSALWFITPAEYRIVWFVLFMPFAISAMASITQRFQSR